LSFGKAFSFRKSSASLIKRHKGTFIAWAIPPFEFENWAVIALGGIPNKVQVGDMGVDVRNDNRAAKLIKLIATCGALDMDDPQPAITVMLPTED
jgi:hypothetical protein